ncbi:MAG: DMT family transporter [bacterium]|nr:DMT family transporter [bacterium]
MSRGVLAALLFVFLWSTSFVPSRIAALEAPPLWFLVARFVSAALFFSVLALVFRLRLPATARRWAALAAIGVFANAGYLGLSYEAFRHLSSAMGAIIACTNPLILAAVSPWLLRERLTREKSLGMALGFGGVVMIMLSHAGSGSARPQDVLLAFAGVAAFVVATVLFKRLREPESLVVVSGSGFASAAIVLAPAAFALEGVPHVGNSGPLLASFIYLVIFLSIGTTLLWFWLLSHDEASRVSAYFFLAPVFGTAIGALLLHEPVYLHDAAGLASIVAGLVLVQRQPAAAGSPQAG